jgi:SinI restriction endonuclease
MAFIKNHQEAARAAMKSIQPDLVDKFAVVVEFLAENTGAASALRGGKTAPPIGGSDYINRQAESFARSRDPRAPQPPATVPDEMVSLILHEYFGLPAADLKRIQNEHSLSMGAENLVGDLLERYIASIVEPHGWVWCSGSMVKAADFIKPPGKPGEVWQVLQIKNRDNSENSSSSAIRVGTQIGKWHRTFSKKVGSNWGEFPDSRLRGMLSEVEFKKFVQKYLGAIRAASSI